MADYVLGVDGGGTKTEVVILDTGGNLLGKGSGGPSNVDDVGVDAARASIGQAVVVARRAVGQGDVPFAAVFLGMAGVVSPDDRAIIRRIAQDLVLAPPPQVGVDHDCRIALAGGLSGRPGIVQIAGTGSSTFGMNAAGDGWRSGGWGHLIADEGSSYWLGIQAMQAAVRAYDGRRSATVLMGQVQAALDLAHMNDIMHRLYVVGLSRVEIAALAPLVIQAAQEGDELACSLIREGTAHLADCVLAVARQLNMAEDGPELAMVGGLFRAGDIIIEPFAQAVHARLPGCRIRPAELPPVLGAAILALQMLSVPLDNAVESALQESATEM